MSYLRGASGYLLVADGTRRTTLDTAMALHEAADRTIGHVPFVLVLNKADLATEWALDDGAVVRLMQSGWRVLRTERQDRRWRRGSVHDARERHACRMRIAMGDELLAGLLYTMGVAVFERRPDGAFVSVTEPPPWFSAMKSDATFPFLGHILRRLPSSGTATWSGRQDWGPCAEVDDHGKEFHYKVTAVQAEERQYLTFQLDCDSDRVREMLQKVREKALAEGTRAKADDGGRLGGAADRNGFTTARPSASDRTLPGAERHRRRGHRRVRRVADERRARRALFSGARPETPRRPGIRGRGASARP